MVAFACDGMLGHLMRWLRLLGFDATYLGSAATDDQILGTLPGSGRVLLTGDLGLVARARRAGLATVAIGEGTLVDQLAGALRGAGAVADPARFLSRCARCNGLLRPVKKAEVASGLPPRVLEGHDAFQRCPDCGQVYWDGTHVRPIRRTLEAVRALLEAKPPSGASDMGPA